MLKLQYFGPLMQSQLIGKDPDAGKDWRQEKGTKEDEMVGWHYQLNGHDLSKLWDMIKDREAWRAVVHRVTKIGHNWVTEQQARDWTQLLEHRLYFSLRWLGAESMLIIIHLDSLLAPHKIGPASPEASASFCGSHGEITFNWRMIKPTHSSSFLRGLINMYVLKTFFF